MNIKIVDECCKVTVKVDICYLINGVKILDHNLLEIVDDLFTRGVGVTPTPQNLESMQKFVDAGLAVEDKYRTILKQFVVFRASNTLKENYDEIVEAIIKANNVWENSPTYYSIKQLQDDWNDIEEN